MQIQSGLDLLTDLMSCFEGAPKFGQLHCQAFFILNAANLLTLESSTVCCILLRYSLLSVDINVYIESSADYLGQAVIFVCFFLSLASTRMFVCLSSVICLFKCQGPHNISGERICINGTIVSVPVVLLLH